MSNHMTKITATTLALLSGSALAGVSTPQVWGPMEHIMLTFESGEVHAHVATSSANPIEMLRFAGETYDGAASVLDDTYYSSQYGWIADGFISLAPDEFMWIEAHRLHRRAQRLRRRSPHDARDAHLRRDPGDRRFR